MFFVIPQARQDSRQAVFFDNKYIVSQFTNMHVSFHTYIRLLYIYVDLFFKYLRVVKIVGKQQWVDGALLFRWAYVCTFVYIKIYEHKNM